MRMKRIALVALATFALISCHSTSTEAATRRAHPAMWKVADADTTIYLFGTIHVLPDGTQWISPKIDAAIRGSQTLVTEIGSDHDPVKLRAVMQGLAFSPGLPPILDRVPADKRALFEVTLKESGIPAEALNGMETWAASLAIISTQLQSLQLSKDAGPETLLETRFVAAHKPVEGLETAESQFRIFDGLSEDAQRVLLTSVATESADMKAEFAKMIATWTAGDVKGIALTFDDELKLSPELTEALLKKRNANWANWVQARLAKPGTVFVAVGAGHLAGANSVEAMLAAKGIKVVRVQ